MKVGVSHLAVDHFQAGKFDQTVAVFRIKARGFRIEDNLTLAHGWWFLQLSKRPESY